MANNLKALRNKLGLSQDEAAARMDTTRNQYAKLEGGRRRLSDVWIDRAASAFGPSGRTSERRSINGSARNNPLRAPFALDGQCPSHPNAVGIE